MKAGIINTVFHVGSTGVLTESLYNALSSYNCDPFVLCSNINETDKKIFKICSIYSQKFHNLAGRITGLNGCFSFIATWKAKRIITSEKPDVLYLGNLHGHYINIYSLLRFLKKKNIPCIQIMWDEYAMTGSCTFTYECTKYKEQCCKCNHIHEYPISWLFDTSRILQIKKRKAYENLNAIFVSVPYTIHKAKESLLLRNSTLVSLDEAVDQRNYFFPRETDDLRATLGIPSDYKVVLNVCCYPSYRKGGQYYLELARQCVDIDKLMFIHVGFLGDTKECPPNYIPVGFINDKELLAEYYSLSDLFVCTSIAETQPDACLEALSCGTRICGFDISGVPTCADPPFGKYVEFPNIDKLKELVIDAPRKTKESIESTSKYARSRFSIHDYNRKLYEYGKALIEK